MTEAVRKRRFTIEEYLCLERDSRDRHEFQHGEILAMSGGPPTHSLIASNVVRTLGNALRGKGCRAYESNLRIRMQGDDRYVYADASVICGAAEYDEGDVTRETIINPRVVVEVLSPSTEAYDRGKKFERYRMIDSLQEYVLVSQDAAIIESFCRQPDGPWTLSAASGVASVIRLRSIDVDLPLSEIYADVELRNADQPEADSAK